MKNIPIVISSYSSVISSGFLSLLSSLGNPSLHISICDPSEIPNRACEISASAIYFLDAASFDSATIEAIRGAAGGNSSIVGIFHCALPEPTAKLYDETLSIYSSNTAVKKILNDLISRLSPDDGSTDELTPREKEIVVGVVKGLSNKEIASDLNVSVNTVMTHRRNIASKLQIHSAAGLTIYAIVSKLVSIDDIKADMI